MNVHYFDGQSIPARGSTFLNEQNLMDENDESSAICTYDCRLGCLVFIVINLVVPQSATSSPQQPHYLIKPLYADRVLYVQPRLALGNLALGSLLTVLEEISQRYSLTQLR
ncbi:MAG: hypothetical protein KME18_18060 [Phormidium tanganyikae FI6-MK23]|jgi:hypothetical protein|nr:hypothetical protein [Phormidium tanganyikae FI6-MK23]